MEQNLLNLKFFPQSNVETNGSRTNNSDKLDKTHSDTNKNKKGSQVDENNLMLENVIPLELLKYTTEDSYLLIREFSKKTMLPLKTVMERIFLWLMILRSKKFPLFLFILQKKVQSRTGLFQKIYERESHFL